jgi:site-specific DNA-methyltransferase (adenine-specific)
MKYQLHHGDCLEVFKTMADNSVDSIVTDPPYGLSFMGKKWDYDVPSEDVWRECLRVLKPGGHLLAFAGTRTQHRMAVRIEDAGFEIRDMIAWVYGSGFPKSLDVSKAIDKAAGAEREVVGSKLGRPGMAKDGSNQSFDGSPNTYGSGGILPSDITAPATDAAKQWQGWGTALKPALEPITVARKPLGEKTVAANVLEHGTGAINVDGCRVATDEKLSCSTSAPYANDRTWNASITPGIEREQNAQGRWPANLIHDGSEEVMGGFPETTSGKPYGVRGPDRYGFTSHEGTELTGYGDSGSAARFFYCAKASKKDRDEGCEGMEARARGERDGRQMGNNSPGSLNGSGEPVNGTGYRAPARNHHPTVKPTNLMRYLCRLVTPPGGTVFDPFMGSGSTGKAAMLEGFEFIGIERDAEYAQIAKARIERDTAQKQLL